MKKYFVTLIVLFTLSSCKNNEAVKVEKVEEEVQKGFVIKLNAIVKKDDSFQVYYRTKSQPTFEEANSLYNEFKGNDKPQDITFILPEGVIPDFIRLDFGVNKEQEPIKVNSLSLSYFGKSFEIQGANFFNYLLVEEKTMSYDKASATLTPIKNGEVYDPVTSSEMKLFEEIQKIVK